MSYTNTLQHLVDKINKKMYSTEKHYQNYLNPDYMFELIEDEKEE
jgi:hypothetical protein